MGGTEGAGASAVGIWCACADSVVGRKIEIEICIESESRETADTDTKLQTNRCDFKSGTAVHTHNYPLSRPRSPSHLHDKKQKKSALNECSLMKVIDSI